MSTDGATQHFATVFRGFDPGQVEAALTAAHENFAAAREECSRVHLQLTSVQGERDDLKRRLTDAQVRLDARASEAASAHDDLQRQIEELQAKNENLQNMLSDRDENVAKQNNFEHLGKRVGQILTLAELEAESLTATAHAEAEKLREDAHAEAELTRRSAEQYGTEIRERAETEAEQVVLEARENAAAIVDEAVRDAAARREEAEAYYERQRAVASEAAAEFERTLSQRRERATHEFQVEISAREEELRRVVEHTEALRTEADQERQDAAAEAAHRLQEAREQAQELLDTARAQAERVRRESERELAAAMARRDSITSQLSNVRSMLATFGLGAGMGEEQLAAMTQATEQKMAQAASEGGEKKETADEGEGDAQKGAAEGEKKPAAPTDKPEAAQN
ncbi:hypothetical protein SAMN05421595_1414 [Austwickia chelonae]|uniref:Cellulose-binding protein n=1 Tax=Austwickia chelonae NBRC 105200 TaxID=1184607 RepID=K6ULV4_9MICO|nr:hypothetical protein [Austwickia chelonae]GAB77576.1 hypothetical protein AUCHE_05_04890 [Austwickia chelonae NBRC 105200]SEW13276.1 hypothetical protein SAMN05421595_1414 [Austwickia chelonae]